MWTLSAHFMQAGASKLETEITVVPVDVGGKRRWIDTRCLDEADPHSFSAQVISRSRELGFLETIDGSEDLLGLTPKGVATCEDYWRRWHQQDPTLPLMSLRAL
ncbi:hypothetical protein DY467_00760 [Rhodopseudomonas sp. BR0G17]|nr:hypothetical protein [Rhodopseudomonas sp. BR0G17]